MAIQTRVQSTFPSILIVATLAAPLSAQTTQRVTLRADGTQILQMQGADDPAISADGRYVVFRSFDTGLVSGDTNNVRDVFLRDRETGTTELVSVSSAGVQGNNDSGVSAAPSSAISADGRYVVFTSWASNLAPGDTNVFWDVFVRDRVLGTTRLVSVATSGESGNGASLQPTISADGRYVAFASAATDLVPGGSNAGEVFVRDLQAGTTELASVSSTGEEADRGAGEPMISADGRYVAFASNADNLTQLPTLGQDLVFVRDRQAAATKLVSLSTEGVVANNASGAPSISADGRFVAFRSTATNLWPVSNGKRQVYVRDQQANTLDLVSQSNGGAISDDECYLPAVSADGRLVVFQSRGSNLVPGDTNGVDDTFLRDLEAGTTDRVDVAHDGAQANNGGVDPAISADGRYVAFSSTSSNLVPGDTNAVEDVFVRDLLGGPTFTSLCDPGASGVIGCPCGNPPSGAGRGCNNSASTGGAVLTAAGGTYLSSDSLVFTTSGEKPTATSVLLQGTTVVASGAVYGQGVRCVGGTLKRLFTKTASGGSVTAPNFGAGDPSVSARSAAKGNPISAGQTRTYLVFYRDPIVLGGCPSGSTFNATQSGIVSWAP